jgi:hypothetical protein
MSNLAKPIQRKCRLKSCRKPFQITNSGSEAARQRYCCAEHYYEDRVPKARPYEESKRCKYKGCNKPFGPKKASPKPGQAHGTVYYDWTEYERREFCCLACYHNSRRIGPEQARR